MARVLRSLHKVAVLLLALVAVVLKLALALALVLVRVPVADEVVSLARVTPVLLPSVLALALTLVLVLVPRRRIRGSRSCGRCIIALSCHCRASAIAPASTSSLLIWV